MKPRNSDCMSYEIFGFGNACRTVLSKLLLYCTKQSIWLVRYVYCTYVVSSSFTSTNLVGYGDSRSILKVAGYFVVH